MDANQQVFVLLTGVACIILASRHLIQQQALFQEVQVNKITQLNLRFPNKVESGSEIVNISKSISKDKETNIKSQSKAIVLRQLINTTLDLSKILHGEIQPKWVPFNRMAYKNFQETSTTTFPTIDPTRWWEHSTVPITETFYEPELPDNSYPRYQKCPLDVKSEAEIYEKAKQQTPLYNLRRDKFLVNVSPFGPNNQFRGFRDTVLLAIHLNRTLVLPPIFKHITDPSYNWHRDFENHMNITWRIDVLRLSKLLPVVNFEEFVRHCRNRDDNIMLLARNPIPPKTFRKLQMYEAIAHDYYRIKDLNISRNLTFDGATKNVRSLGKTVVLPSDVEHKAQVTKMGKVNYAKLYFSHKQIQMAYGENVTGNGRCMIWTTVFRSVDWDKHLRDVNSITKSLNLGGKIKRNENNSDKLSDTAFNQMSLVREMIYATRRPKSVEKFAIDFKNDIVGADYITIHWRYDEKDFLKMCSVKYYLPACRTLNHSGKNFTSTQLSKNIGHFIDSKKVNPDNIRSVYFAAPQDITTFIESVSEELRRLDILAYDQRDLRVYMKQTFVECENIKMANQTHEFVSQVEQEIAYKSEMFLYSDGSTWSDGVMQERTVNLVSQRDRDNFLILEEADLGNEKLLRGR